MAEMSEGRAARPALPDLVYVVRPGDENEELRFSLRSVAANLPHRKVWIVGSVPALTSNLEGLSLKPHPIKYENIRQSLTAVVNHPELTDEFVLMNDDMFVMAPVQHPLPVGHLGSLREYLDFLTRIGKRENEWMVSMRDTLGWCGGDPHCYETHTPLTFSKEALRGALSAFPKHLTFTPTGVYQLAGAGTEGVLGVDSKVTTGDFDEHATFLSTEDWSFRDQPVGRFIRRRFPEKCEYEK